MKKKVEIAVVVVAYSSREWISKCLLALSEQTVIPSEVIVVENGSPEGKALRAEDLPSFVKFVKNDINLGFAVANNEAVKLTKARWVAFLNPDAFPEPRWLEELLAATHRWPDARIFGSTQVQHGEEDRLDGAGDAFHVFGLPFRSGFGNARSRLPEEGKTFSACGAAMMIDRSLFEHLGGFDDHYFCYCEDVDLGFRARLLGEEAVQVRNAVVHHVGSASSSRWSAFAVYHGTRNRIWVYFKCMPMPWLWIMLPFNILASAALFVLSIRRGAAIAYLRGILDGVTGLDRVWPKRALLQKGRKAKVNDIMRMMVWNPAVLLTRSPQIIRRTSATDTE